MVLVFLPNFFSQATVGLRKWQAGQKDLVQEGQDVVVDDGDVGIDGIADVVAILAAFDWWLKEWILWV